MKGVFLALLLSIACSSRAQQPVPQTKEGWQELLKATKSTTDESFGIINAHKKTIDSLLGANTAEDKIKWLIYNAEIKPFETRDTISWPMIRERVKKYGPLGEEIYLKSRAYSAFNRKSYTNFAEWMHEYFVKYTADRPDPIQLNNFAFSVFKNVPTKKHLRHALQWVNDAFDRYPLAQIMDTKANLLYKIGKKKRAIQYQKQAVALSKEKPFPGLEQELLNTLAKMEQGKPTW